MSPGQGSRLIRIQWGGWCSTARIDWAHPDGPAPRETNVPAELAASPTRGRPGI